MSNGRRRARAHRHRGRGLAVAAVATAAAVSGGAWAAARDTPSRPAEATAPAAAPRPERPRVGTPDRRDRPPAIRWRRSQESGTPGAGRLGDGVLLPTAGTDFFTWDRVHHLHPNPPGRRWGSDRAIRKLLDVLRDHRAADPDAARVGVGDLSRPGGGPFTGPGGHVSHQNGLDVDVLYPRRDRRLRPPIRLAQVDRRRTQDLVDRFVAAGAERVFVDARLGLSGPAEIVQPWPSHDDHLHVRFRPRASAGPRRG